MRVTIASASSTSSAVNITSTGSPGSLIGRSSRAGLQPMAVMADQAVRGGQDVSGRAAVLEQRQLADLADGRSGSRDGGWLKRWRNWLKAAYLAPRKR
jgi:hypothetical protein